jgi:Smg protein
MYIFSSYADQDENLPEDRDGIDADLRSAGFDSLEIDKAFDWLDGLAQVEDDTGLDQSDSSIRVLAPEESARLAYNAQGFLLFLEQSGVLTPRLREMVINRVMALESDSEVDVEELKWIVMMVLFNSSEEQDENALMHYEDIVFSDQSAVFH